MSKKGKAILASALFGAAIFGASCGGGGGGASTPPPPPPPPSPASDIAKVLVLAAKGLTSPGALIGLYEGTVKDDGTVVWSADLNPGDQMLEYLHEFSNRSVLLYDTGSGDLYIYDNGTLSPVKNGAGIGSFWDNNIYLPHFVVYNDDPGGGVDIDFVATSGGKALDFIVTGVERLIYAGENYVVIGDGAANERVYIVKKDGTMIELDWDDSTKAIDPIDNGQALLLDRLENTDIILLGHNSANTNAVFVIDNQGNPVRITNSTNVATGDDPMNNIDSGKIVRDANGNVYVAVLSDPDGTNNTGDEIIQYFKIVPPLASSVVFTPNTPINVNGGNNANVLAPSLYALDGAGHLYFIGETYDADPESELTQAFIDASNIFSISAKNDLANTDMNNSLILAFSNGVLISDPTFNNFYHFIYNSAQPTNVALNPNVIGAVQVCNELNTIPLIAENEIFYTKTKQEPIVGEGTDRIMCGSATEPDTFAWIEYKGSGLYNGDYTEDVNNNTATTLNILRAIATSNSMVYVVETFPNFTKTYECPFGTAFSSGQTCTVRNMNKAFFFDIYPDVYPIFSALESNYKFKTDTNVLSDGARYIYGGIGAGVAPNIKAAYFTDVISAPYTVNIQTGAVDTSTLNIPFTTAGWGARGGNVSLELDKAAHVYKPITGAQCPAGLYDFVWYKDASHNFNNLTRPQNTCLISVLQVRNP